MIPKPFKDQQDTALVSFLRSSLRPRLFALGLDTVTIRHHTGPAGEHGLSVIPSDFVQDFEPVCEATLDAFANAPDGHALRESLDRAFNRVFLLKDRPPLP